MAQHSAQQSRSCLQKLVRLGLGLGQSCWQACQLVACCLGCVELGCHPEAFRVERSAGGCSSHVASKCSSSTLPVRATGQHLPGFREDPQCVAGADVAKPPKAGSTAYTCKYRLTCQLVAQQQCLLTQLCLGATAAASAGTLDCCAGQSGIWGGRPEQGTCTSMPA